MVFTTKLKYNFKSKINLVPIFHIQCTYYNMLKLEDNISLIIYIVCNNLSFFLLTRMDICSMSH